MRGDNVEIVLAADRDLGEVVRDHPKLADAVPGLHLNENPVYVQVGEYKEARPEGVSTERYARIDPPQAMDLVGWEPDELALLEHLGPFTHAFSLEATSAPLACELICALAPRCRLAVDNDFDGILSAAEFCALDRSAQIDFIQAKYSDEALARLSEIAHGGRRH